MTHAGSSTIATDKPRVDNNSVESRTAVKNETVLPGKRRSRFALYLPCAHFAATLHPFSFFFFLFSFFIVARHCPPKDADN